jgi:TRAP-type C4-dicarboxylate transport system permease small subunit
VRDGPRTADTLDGLIGAIAVLSRLFGVIAVGLLLAATAVVCQVVLLRYFLGGSAIWQYEFINYSLIAATFLGSPYVLLTRGHVHVDLVPQLVPRRLRFALALLATLLALAFVLVLFWQGVGFTWEAWSTGKRGSTIWAPPLWVPYLSLPLGMGLVALQYLADLAALVTGREPPFGMPEPSA